MKKKFNYRLFFYIFFFLLKRYNVLKFKKFRKKNDTRYEADLFSQLLDIQSFVLFLFLPFWLQFSLLALYPRFPGPVHFLSFTSLFIFCLFSSVFIPSHDVPQSLSSIYAREFSTFSSFSSINSCSSRSPTSFNFSSPS